MNNEPVAWMVAEMVFDTEEAAIAIGKTYDDEIIPLYTHPVKELKNIVVASATCSCGKVMEVTNLQPVKELTDEEIGDIWVSMLTDTREEIIEFARAILRKASEK